MYVRACDCVGVWEKPRDRCKDGTNSTKCSYTTDMRLVCVDRVNDTQTLTPHIQTWNVVVTRNRPRLAAKRMLLLTSVLLLICSAMCKRFCICSNPHASCLTMHTVTLCDAFSFQYALEFFLPLFFGAISFLFYTYELVLMPINKLFSR